MNSLEYHDKQRDELLKEFDDFKDRVKANAYSQLVPNQLKPVDDWDTDKPVTDALGDKIIVWNALNDRINVYIKSSIESTKEQQTTIDSIVVLAEFIKNVPGPGYFTREAGIDDEYAETVFTWIRMLSSRLRSMSKDHQTETRAFIREIRRELNMKDDGGDDEPDESESSSSSGEDDGSDSDGEDPEVPAQLPGPPSGSTTKATTRPIHYPDRILSQ